MRKRWEKDYSLKIGKKIKKLREISGLSQSELAEKIGVSYQQIQKYERGKSSISVDRLYQIADVLKVPVKIFFEEEHKGVAESREEYKTGIFELEKEEVQFLSAFKGIRSKNLRQSLLKLLREISRWEKES